MRNTTSYGPVIVSAVATPSNYAAANVGSEDLPTSGCTNAEASICPPHLVHVGFPPSGSLPHGPAPGRRTVGSAVPAHSGRTAGAPPHPGLAPGHVR